MNIKELFADLQVTDHAKTAQMETVSYLRNKGFIVHIEHKVIDRGDGKIGYIDIVAEKDGIIIGIEFDKHAPRKKSLFKLKNFDCDYRFVLLRGRNRYFKKGNIEVLSIKLKRSDQYATIT